VKASLVVGAILIGVAVAIVVYRSLPSDATSSAAPVEAVIADTGPGQSELPDGMTAETTGANTLRAEAPGQASEIEEQDNQLDRYREDLAEGVYRLAGRQIVQMLSDSGLALADSEAIARQYAGDSADCSIDALMAEAARQSISVEELMSQISAAAADGGSPFGVIDRASVEAHAAPCEADALQRAGISVPPDSQQISDEEIERLRECIEAYSDTDITDRGTILEICGQEVFDN
jgi:hypothetical protein